MGVRVPDRRAGDARPAAARPGGVAGIPRSRRRAGRSSEARFHSWECSPSSTASSRSPKRRGRGALSVSSIAVGLAVGVVFVLPTVGARSTDRPSAVRRACVQHSPYGETFALFAWAGSYLFLAQYLQLMEAAPLEAGGVVAPRGGRKCCRVDARPAARAPNQPRPRGVGRSRARRRGLCSADPGRSDGGARRPGGRIGGARWHVPEGDVGHRSDRRRHAAGAGRGGMGDLRPATSSASRWGSP